MRNPFDVFITWLFKKLEKMDVFYALLTMSIVFIVLLVLVPYLLRKFILK